MRGVADDTNPTRKRGRTITDFLLSDRLACFAEGNRLTERRPLIHRPRLRVGLVPLARRVEANMPSRSSRPRLLNRVGGVATRQKDQLAERFSAAEV